MEKQFHQTESFGADKRSNTTPCCLLANVVTHLVCDTTTYNRHITSHVLNTFSSNITVFL